jgi:glycosyltransferase involved in cell wall biosynthesis
MDSPKVSIITPSFNRADIVHETAESIFRQTYTNWEWVIVDDGSTDNSWQVLESFAAKEERVKILKRNREPKGACTCRNIAVEKCSGDYLIFLDTDDLLAPFCIEQRVAYIQQHPINDFIIFPMLLFRKQPYDTMLLWNIDSHRNDVERIMFGDPVCQGTGTIWKKSSFVKIGMWDEKLLLWQDIELHLRSLLKDLNYMKCFQVKPDVFLRLSDMSLSRTAFHSLHKFRSRRRVFEQTLMLIFEKNALANYRHCIRYMFTDLFINAVRSNFLSDADQLLQMQRQCNLFDSKEQKNFIRYAFLYRSKLYKIGPLKNYFEKLLRHAETAPENYLNKVVYQHT